MAIRDRISEGLDYLQNLVEDRAGVTLVDTERLDLLEQTAIDYSATRKELDLLGWHVLDFLSGAPNEVKLEQRRKWALNSRIAWIHDPMAGSAVDLLNDFTFSRGVPRPRARMDEVQAVIDEAWDDADNQAVLTTFSSQVALGTDLQLQSNLFVLFFDDGEDGLVKLSLLDHDTVVDAVRDPENRLRVLYYAAHKRETEWDFDTDTLKSLDVTQQTPKVVYYAHWRNVRDAVQEFADGKRAEMPPKPPDDKMGEGVVYHIAVNRMSEMVFGVPKMQRTLRWFSAYNDFMAARVDMAKAAAALIMKRKVKGSPSQLSRMAAQAISRGGEVGTIPNPTAFGPKPAAVVQENENVNHEAFKLDSGAGNAAQDATMLRSQVSAGTRFPQHYLGDQGNANLATATAMDLPVTKMVESQQELFEQLFRAFIDRVIERAVEKGRLKIEPDDSVETGATANGNGKNGKVDIEADNAEKMALRNASASASPDVNADEQGNAPDRGPTPKKIDLTYEFKMPSAIKRLMSDLVVAVGTIAKTFDPNGTNIELARTLLTIVLGDALEMQDPADAVERIFPAGYVDPLVQQQLEAGAPGPGQNAAPDANTAADGGGTGMTLQDLLGKGGPNGKGGTPAVGGQPGTGRRGPYGTKSQGSQPQTVQAAEDVATLADVIAEILETRFADLPESVQRAAAERIAASEDEFAAVVGTVAEDVVGDLERVAGGNGHVAQG